MLDTEDLDNLLVGQKNRIIRLIDTAKTLADIHAVTETLLTLKPLWTACNYRYKHDEVTQRLLNKHNTLAQKRKDRLQK